MTSTECTEWSKYHGARFPRFAKWIKEPPKKKTDPSPSDKLQACYEALSSATLDDAKRATETFYCGSERFTDEYSCGSHAVDVARVARFESATQDRRYIDPPSIRDAFKCSLCQDSKSGILSVYGPPFIQWFARQMDDPPIIVDDDGWKRFNRDDPRWVEAFKNEKLLRYGVKGFAVWCSCKEWTGSKGNRTRMLTFDASRMVPIALSADVGNVLEFCGRNPTGRHYDEWNPDNCAEAFRNVRLPL